MGAELTTLLSDAIDGNGDATMSCHIRALGPQVPGYRPAFFTGVGATTAGARQMLSCTLRPASSEPDEIFCFDFDGADADLASPDLSDGRAVAIFRGAAALSNAETNQNTTTALRLGSGDFISIRNGRIFSALFSTPENGDRTLEMTFRLDNVGGDVRTLFCSRDGTAQDDINFFVNTDGSIQMQIWNAGTLLTTIASAASLVSALTWYHVAATFNSSTRLIEIFFDGNRVASGTPSDYGSRNDGPLRIGTNVDAADGNYLIGYVENARMSSSILYSGATYTIPPSKFTGNQALEDAADPEFQDVAFLSAFDGADGDTAATDESSFAAAITFNNAPQLDDAQVQFGSTSLLLASASNQSVSIPDDNRLSLVRQGAMTFEAWIRPTATSLGKASSIMNKRDTGGAEECRLSCNTNARIEFITFASGNAQASAISANNALTADTWHHVAACWIRDMVLVFVDGKLVATAHDDTVPTENAGALHIGRSQFDSGRGFDGHIDEARVARSFAYSPRGFLPRSAPFPRS